MLKSLGRSGNFHLLHWWKSNGALYCPWMDNYRLLVLRSYVLTLHNSRSSLQVARKTGCDCVWNSVDRVIAVRVAIIFVLTVMCHLQFCAIYRSRRSPSYNVAFWRIDWCLSPCTLSASESYAIQLILSSANIVCYQLGRFNLVEYCCSSKLIRSSWNTESWV
jgi:hypothetical protein